MELLVNLAEDLAIFYTVVYGSIAVIALGAWVAWLATIESERGEK